MTSISENIGFFSGFYWPIGREAWYLDPIEGLESSALGVSLFSFQFDHLAIPFSDLLGEEIELHEGWEGSLRREMDRVIPAVWIMLSDRLNHKTSQA